MSNSTKPSGKGSNENSLWVKILVPVAVALIAGGTAPWWINSTKDSSSQSVEVPEPTRESEVESASRPDSVSGNKDRPSDISINQQGQGSQAVIQGSGNNVIQGSGNQLTVQKASEATSRGEFDLPAISGMSYHDARKKLIEQGWIPATQRHFYGASEPGLQFGTGKVFWELGYWEVVSCTGTAEGFCRFQFDDPSGRRLIVITAGMEDPNRGFEAQINRVFFEEDS